MPRASTEARHGIHVLDREGDARSTPRGRAMPSTKSRGVVLLPAERRVHDDHLGADRVRHLGGALELAPGLGAPDPLGEQQARRVDGGDRDAVVLGELLDRGDLLAERVDADHHLDGVVAEARGVAEGVRGRLGVDRGGREADRGSRQSGMRPMHAGSGRAARGSRPRAAPTGRSRARSRSKMSMQASATSAPGTIWWARLGETPGRSASSSRVIATSLGIHSRSVGERQRARHQRRRRRTGRRRRSGPASGRSSRSRPPGRAAGAEQVAGVAGDLGADLAAQLADGRPRRARPSAKCVRASRAAPSGSDQATSGASSAPPAISSEPPPMSKTDEPAGRPAEPAAYGEEGQPRLVLAGEHVDRARRCARWTCSRTVVAVAGVADRGGREAEDVLAALVLGDPQRLGREGGERVDPGLGHVAGVVEVLGEPQRLLVGVRRQRRGAAVGVDHQQVPGVGADVEDAQAHGSNVLARVSWHRRLAGARGRPGVSPCVRRVRQPRRRRPR